MRLADYGTLGDVVAPIGDAARTATAIVFEGRSVSYGALDQAADRLADGLIDRGVAPGDRIAVLGRNTPAFFEILFGCMKAGAILVPVNCRLTAAAVAVILNDAVPTLTFVERGIEHLVGADGGEVIVFEDVDGTRYDPDPRAAAFDTHATHRKRDDVAMLIYTSGDTDAPKGAMMTHGNFARYCDLDTVEPSWLGIARDEVCLAILPLCHVGGLEMALRALFTGATVVLHRDFDLRRIIHDIAHHRVTLTGLAPSALRALLAHPDAADADFSSLRRFLYGTAPIPAGLLKEGLERLGCAFVQSYGMTESNGACIMLGPDDHADADAPHLRSAGVPVGDAQVRIAHADERDVAAGAVGEILIRSSGVMRGYWRRPEATAAAIDDDGWLHSGDAGYRDGRGFIHVCGRMSDAIRTGAENVYPAEVECAIYGHEDVVDVAVVGVPDAHCGEAVTAVVVAREGAALDARAVRAFAQARMAPFKVPRYVRFVDLLPRSAAGKVLRSEVRRALGQEIAAI